MMQTSTERTVGSEALVLSIVLAMITTAAIRDVLARGRSRSSMYSRRGVSPIEPLAPKTKVLEENSTFVRCRRLPPQLY